MNLERWRKAEALFHEALAQPSEDRPAFLERGCGEDEELRRLVGMLVAQDDRAGSFLERPLLDGAETAGPPGALAGRELGPYRVLALLGTGGMGEVYRAHDTRLGRDVALKTLPPAFAGDPASREERLARFRREARILASLNHPNIAAIYGLEELPDLDCLVLELVEGDTLRGPLPVPAVLHLARQVAEALDAAHQHGIIHRDLKPANLKVTPEGRVKVLDFGIAKALPEAAPSSVVAGGASGTLGGRAAGTPGYMSPEQARGEDVDQRADIWAYGCLLYELLAGRRAFEGESLSEIIAAVLEREPDWRLLRGETPPELVDLLRRCLEKDRVHRPARMAEVLEALDAVPRRPGALRLAASIARRPRFAVPAVAVALLLSLWGTRWYRQQADARWAREEAIPEIARLMDAGEFPAAFRLIRRADRIIPGHPVLQRFHGNIGMPTRFVTEPPGAIVFATGFAPEDDDWVRAGTTPFTTTQLPLGYYRLRIEKPGYRTVTGTGEVRGGTTINFVLDAEGTVPGEMVRVAGALANLTGLPAAKVPSFLIDRFEITNRQFKQFVEAGGYRRRDFWPNPFVRDGRGVSWEEAMQRFQDATGHPGPSTWKRGEYPPGQDDSPVGGVSWFEAAAYAVFAGKRLPTIYHWEVAASPGWYAEIVEHSNFRGEGAARVGAYHGLGAFGTSDMAGNVKEWCWNEAGSGQRYIRGGAWNDPMWMFAELDARSPWDRSPGNGIRCARYGHDDVSGMEVSVAPPFRDPSRNTSVNDDVFELYRSLYRYDPGDLDARVEGVDEETADWTRERVSFAAPYGNERMTAYFYVPKGVNPPYQAVIYANPGMALRLPSPQPAERGFFEFVVKGGRAFLHPVLKGYYQRRSGNPPAGPNDMRDRLVLESKDFRRAIDYLASRPDVDRNRLGLLGYSRGASLVSVLAVGETRVKAAVLQSVGLSRQHGLLPEVDPVNFLPRFRVPTLMANFRSDFNFPLETSQRPMLRLLGAPGEHKRLELWDGGHGDMRRNYQPITREMLAWFDKYLGAVGSRATAR